MNDHDKPIIVPDERAAIVVLCARIGHLAIRELRWNLTRDEVADLDEVTASAITAQEAFDGRHTDSEPIGADGIMLLVEARREVLDRLASLRRKGRRRR